MAFSITGVPNLDHNLVLATLLKWCDSWKLKTSKKRDCREKKKNMLDVLDF